MQKSGPIIVIEDDKDDQEFLEETFTALDYPNQVIFFSDGYQALDYIEKTDSIPFLILSDINMPKINGFELRKKIHNNENLKIRSIPYLLFSSSAQKKTVYEAYSTFTQGFFLKPNSMDQLKNTIKKIVEYWQECHLPSQYY